MNMYLRAYAEASEAQDGSIRFVASTEGVKRDGLDLKAENWLLENYRRNPVVLFAHDYRSLPVGRADVFIDGYRLIADVTFDPEDERARMIESKYRRGFLNAVSVGWDNVGRKYDLMDISVAPVPVDPQALVQIQRAALSDIGEQIIQMLEQNDDQEKDANNDVKPVESGQMIWRGVATAMGDLLQVAPGEMAEDDRKRIYNDLERLYRRLGKTPPEYMTAEQLAALGDDELRGLLLEGEPFEGRALRFTREAVENLRRAGELIQSVVSGVVVEEEEPDDTPHTDEKNLEALRKISARLQDIGGNHA